LNATTAKRAIYFQTLSFTVGLKIFTLLFFSAKISGNFPSDGSKYVTVKNAYHNTVKSGIFFSKYLQICVAYFKLIGAASFHFIFYCCIAEYQLT